MQRQNISLTLLEAHAKSLLVDTGPARITLRMLLGPHATPSDIAVQVSIEASALDGK